ncbi:phosphoribosylamine--glycine ligase [Caldicellulosiruptoraceae bacterium PP1]
MEILVIGNGGREHAIIWKLLKDGYKNLYCIPGNAGISQLAKCIDMKINDFKAIADFCVYNSIDFVIVGPDNPLADGIVDFLKSRGIKTFGPSKMASEIESSKVFSKNLMKKYLIPTASYECFNNSSNAIQYTKNKNRYPIVIKADGLALGKGVYIAYNEDEAICAINEIMVDKKFGESGSKIVIEEYLEGFETSFFIISDGKNIVPLTTAKDYKKAFDQDKGPNTGGMGSYSPNNMVDKKTYEYILENIMEKTVYAMNKEGRPFVGVLYGGLILTQDGPKVLEFNARFGDPETQAIMPLINSDLLEIMIKAYEGNLKSIDIDISSKNSLCLVLASNGYPDKYETGYKIEGMEYLSDDVILYHANTKFDENKNIITAGGRVLNICAIGESLSLAREKVYSQVTKIKYDNIYYRKDIGI